VRGELEATSFIEMGGRGVGSSDHRVTETSIRGFWQEYRRLMGF
jgi:anthranilate 1,2-dioxygenase large subunit